MKNKKIGLIVLIAILASTPLFIVLALSNWGGSTRTIDSSSFRFTGNFILRGYDALNHTSENLADIEIDFAFGIYSHEHENRTATNQQAGETITLSEKSYFVIETFHNATYLPYSASGVIYVEQGSTSNTMWVPFYRCADRLTWMASLTGDHSQCSDIQLDTDETININFLIPENDPDRPGGELNFNLGHSYKYPSGAIDAYQVRFFQDITLADGNTYPGCQYSGLWLKFENASLTANTTVLLNGVGASYLETGHEQIYILLNNIDCYNDTQAISINFDNAPDIIRIWDGLIGDENAGRAHAIA